MKISPSRAKLGELSSDLIVCVVKPDEIRERGKKARGGRFSELDTRLGGILRRTLERAEFKGNPGDHFLFTLQDPKISALLVYVWEVAPKGTFDTVNRYRKLGSSIHAAAEKLGAGDAVLMAEHLQLDRESNAAALVEGLILTGYRYERYKSKKSAKKPLGELSIFGGKGIRPEILDRTLQSCGATSLARDLINMPPNDCTPPYLVSVAKEIASKGKLKIQVFDKTQLAKLGAHSLLAVAKGTVHPPFLVKLTYTPAKRSSKTKVISLVGKGITFDTGGYSLKPGDSMIGMKGDMAGAAAVLGVMQLVSRLKPSCEVRGYIATTENMISGEATRVGDIVTAMNGKTVEILNTDAEGRLILADALALASRDKADTIIDIATLTGACVVALGMDYAGLFTDSDALARSIVETGEITGERYWRLPLAPEYRDSIKSKVADLKNISGNRWGGATIGALFLQEFVTAPRWAHLDIAGPSDSERDAGHIRAGGVGFAVRTLGRFILER